MRSSLNHLKRQIVVATMATKEGHIASAFSILDLVWVLYHDVLGINPQNFRNEDRNYFILSKGHGSLALYAVLAEQGFFPLTDLDQFATYSSCFGGHPDCNKVPGVEASTGSLGHGLPLGVGVALGQRIRKIGRRVFVIVGDAECNEGAVWEAALLAAHHKLSNLTCIVDYNHSTDRALGMGDLAGKWKAFGWAASTVNGHDHTEILDALKQSTPDRPTAIVAQTIKGFGCKQMEGNPAWHHRSPTREELSAILEELA
jgi:transketolase